MSFVWFKGCEEDFWGPGAGKEGVPKKQRSKTVSSAVILMEKIKYMCKTAAFWGGIYGG